MARHSSILQNNLKRARTRAGLTQSVLAAKAGISRQAYSSLEAGVTTPSTDVAIQLARTLKERVESLFYFPEESFTTVEAELVFGATSTSFPNQRARLFRVGEKLLARPLAGSENTRHCVVAAEGLIVVPTDSSEGERGVTVLPFDADEVEAPTLSMLGCDPAVGLLERGLQAKGISLVSGEESSYQALIGLANGEAHVAGCHLLDHITGVYNSPWVARLVPFPCTLVTFASWQQGLIVPYGNPKHLHSVADLIQPGTTLINRQVGSGSRDLLDRLLAKAKIPGKNILGYKKEEYGHLGVAAAVAAGSADVGVGVKAAAVAMGLDFMPIEEERYDLVIPNHFLDEPPIQVLLDLLRQSVLHRRVESLGGYDISEMGIQQTSI